MKTQILLIENNERLNTIFTNALEKTGYAVHSVTTGIKGILTFEAEDISLVIIGLMLSDLSGEHIIKRIRDTKNTPIIVISSQNTDSDKVHHLAIGADDYLAKPFSISEFIVRVKALLRRAHFLPDYRKTLKLSDSLEIDLVNHIIVKDKKTIRLTKKETLILGVLSSNLNNTVKRELLYANVWKKPYDGDENVLNVNMYRLREKIEKDPKEPQYLLSVWGIGYMLDGRSSK